MCFSSESIQQRGQTLIETMVAVFVLAMGITAAVGLAIYGLNASTNISNQIIATGLAREGLEAVKNMRDTNWLKDNLSDDCYNYASNPVGQPTAHCYDDWLSGPGNPNNAAIANGYDLEPSGGLRPNTMALRTNVNQKLWNMTERNNNTTNYYGLNLVQNITNAAFAGYYVPTGNSTASSGFYRKIILQNSIPSPYQSELELLTVTVEVWWRDVKKCTTAASAYSYDTAPISCRLRVQTYLTNWKNYEIAP